MVTGFLAPSPQIAICGLHLCIAVIRYAVYYILLPPNPLDCLRIIRKSQRWH